MKSGGITSVTLANNHIGDYRTESALLTKQILVEHSIDFAGLTQGTGPHYSLQVIYEFILKDLSFFFSKITERATFRATFLKNLEIVLSKNVMPLLCCMKI